MAYYKYISETLPPHSLTGSISRKPRRGSSMNPQEPSASNAFVDSLREEYQRLVEVWGTSENRVRLECFLAEELSLPRDEEITRCVCFGVGSFLPSPEPLGRWPGDTVENRFDQCTRVMEQLVLVSRVVEALRQVHPICEVVFQDPLFTSIDRMFLESLGFVVGTACEGLERLGQGSFVYAPFPPNAVVADVFAKCNPALYLGAELAGIVRDGGLDDGDRASLVGYEGNALAKRMPALNGYGWSVALWFHWLE